MFKRMNHLSNFFSESPNHLSATSVENEHEETEISQRQLKSSKLEARVAKLKLLEDQNILLREQLSYVHKLESANRKLLEEVRVVSAKLQKAVLDFRKEQVILDSEFLQAAQV
jgi:hypothetical protein